jgi:hypothetical protein
MAPARKRCHVVRSKRDCDQINVTFMCAQEAHGCVELRASKGIVKPPMVIEPRTTSVDKSLCRLAWAAEIDHSEVRRSNAQTGRKDVNVACVET